MPGGAAQTEVTAWLVARGRDRATAEATCAALTEAEVPRDQWVSELQGMETDRVLGTFLTAVDAHRASPQPIVAPAVPRPRRVGPAGPLLTCIGLGGLLGQLAVDAVFDTDGRDGALTTAGYTYYCTLLDSLTRWPQLLRVAVPIGNPCRGPPACPHATRPPAPAQ